MGRNILLSALFLACPTVALAGQSISSPSQCILDHLQNVSSALAGVVRYNCVQQYINSNQNNLVPINARPNENSGIIIGNL